MIQILVLIGVGVLLLGGIVAVFVKSRQSDNSDTVPQNVLTRINAEYRDIH